MLNLRSMDKKKMGEALQRLRNRAGLTQTDLANKAGLSLSIIQKVEASGDVLKGTPPTHRKIGEALGLSTLEGLYACLADESSFVSVRMTRGTFAGLTARAHLVGMTLDQWFAHHAGVIVEVHDVDPKTPPPTEESAGAKSGRKPRRG